MDIIKRLFELQDKGYQSFQGSLIPDTDETKIIGVRTPVLREFAKELEKMPDKEAFLKQLPHTYHEENLLHFFLISRIKDYDECLKAVDEFLPYIDNWAVCDQGGPLVFKKHKDRLIQDIRRWIASDHLYTSRFGMRMLMNHFLDDDFQADYLDLVSQKTGDEYYLQMMQAWFFATAAAKQYEATIPYFEEKRLHPWVHRKAIQKSIESFRVTQEHKDYLRTLR